MKKLEMAKRAVRRAFATTYENRSSLSRGFSRYVDALRSQGSQVEIQGRDGTGASACRQLIFGPKVLGSQFFRCEATYGLASTSGAMLGSQRGLSAYTGTARGSEILCSSKLSHTHSGVSPVPALFGSSWRRSMSSVPAAGSLPDSIRNILYAMLFLGCAMGTYYANPWFQRPTTEAIVHEDHSVTNWSNTHEAHPKVYHQPDSLEELERIVRLCHLTRKKIRPVGSGLSPNGLGFSDEGMLNLALMDKVVNVDEEKKQVTVQAGARIDEVVEALKPHGLTLENYASIKEQQIGGFTQVGAHGTGAAIPPVDERVVSLKLVTPSKGTLELSPESDPDLFYLARCGLGALGVVAEVTLQCVPAHKLVEHTFVTNIKDVRKNHKKWLQDNKHLRYMWIPNTDTVVVVQCNPLSDDKEPPKQQETSSGYSHRVKPMLELYNEAVRKLHGTTQSGTKSQQGLDDLPRQRKKVDEKAGVWSGTSAGSHEPFGVMSMQLLTFPEMRDKVLALDPLNPDHVKAVNKAEAEYWKRSQGYRVGWSHEILGFDCGGQQWVSEVCFPAGAYDKPDLKDVKYMEDLLQLIKKNNIPAPAPIEQRWTASSRSSMSPASDPSPERLFSWVGIIMYLPSDDSKQRQAITDRFFEYRNDAQKSLWDAYNGFEHWAKIEVRNSEEADWIRARLKAHFPVDAFNKARRELDPKNILSNYLIDALFPFEVIEV